MKSKIEEHNKIELGTGPGDGRHEVHGQLGNVEVALVEKLWQL